MFASWNSVLLIEFFIMPKIWKMKTLRAFSFVLMTIGAMMSVFAGNNPFTVWVIMGFSGYVISIIVILCQKPELKGVLFSVVLELLTT